MGKSQDLYKKAKTMIPGGTQLLSKRPEMFLPDLWPAYYSKAKGCEVWDLDGNKYTDMSYMGIGACILGYADDDVNEAVKDAVDRGSMCTLNAPEEVELAELLLGLHPWAGMVRYSRTGGEAMAIAVRIARTASKKDTVLFCGYHGWSDWYLAANLADDSSLDGHLLPGLNPAGVPRALKGTAIPFNYNDTKGFNDLVEKNKENIGVIVLEAVRNEEPGKEFIDAIKLASKKYGIVLVLDEITSGWRLNLGGAHLIYGIDPDIAVFGKGMSNGFPMGAVIGRSSVMEKAQDTFISSTYWTERIGPAAAIATIKKMKKIDLHAHLAAVGKKAKNIWEAAGKSNGLNIEVGGMDQLGHFSFKTSEPLVLKTLFTQFMLEKGFLATTACYASYAHKDNNLEAYSKAANEVFKAISDAVKQGNPEIKLKGPVCQSGFKRLT